MRRPTPLPWRFDRTSLVKHWVWHLDPTWPNSAKIADPLTVNPRPRRCVFNSRQTQSYTRLITKYGMAGTGWTYNYDRRGETHDMYTDEPFRRRHPMTDKYRRRKDEMSQSPLLYYVSRDRFLKEEVWEPNSGGSRISKWGDEAPYTPRRLSTPRRVECGEGVSPPHWEGFGEELCPSTEKKFRLWILNRRILVQAGCFFVQFT